MVVRVVPDTGHARFHVDASAVAAAASEVLTDRLQALDHGCRRRRRRGGVVSSAGVLLGSDGGCGGWGCCGGAATCGFAAAAGTTGSRCRAGPCGTGASLESASREGRSGTDFTLLVLSGASGAGAACFGTDFFFSSSETAVTVVGLPPPGVTAFAARGAAAAVVGALAARGSCGGAAGGCRPAASAAGVAAELAGAEGVHAGGGVVAASSGRVRAEVAGVVWVPAGGQRGRGTSPSVGAALVVAAVAASRRRVWCRGSLGSVGDGEERQGGAAVGSLGGVAAAAAGARARKVTPRLDVEPGVAEAALARGAPDDGKPLRSPAKGDR